jgi:hypothetical protein
MALKGNLRDFSITQLLNLIHLARKTGILVCEGPEGETRLSFREGKLAYAGFITEDDSLAVVLHAAQKISTSQFRLLKERAAKMADKELGLLLINAGYLSQEDILISLQQQYLSVVRRLFNWVEGTFTFQAGSPPPADKIPARVNLENLIIEASRQARELEHLQEELPSLDVSLRFAERPGANIRNVNLSVEEWRVVSYINPKNSMRQIARAAGLSDLEIRRVIFSLLQAGLVELVRQQVGSPLASSQRVHTAGNRDEQKSLVNRLIMRIRSI